MMNCRKDEQATEKMKIPIGWMLCQRGLYHCNLLEGRTEKALFVVKGEFRYYIRAMKFCQGVTVG